MKQKKIYKESLWESPSLRIIIRTIFITYILTAIFLLLLAFGLYQLHLSESQVNLGINVI